MDQIIYFNNEITETHNFKFGFCMPNTTNTYQNIIEVSKNTIPAKILSGNIVLVTKFLSNNIEICSNSVKIYYE